MEDVKLLSVWDSPYAMRARIALEAKGMKYELIEEDLSSKSQLLLESNPVYKKVPVLLHNGKAICESVVIVQYIDDAWPLHAPSFFPKDLQARAMIRFWTDFIDQKIWDIGIASTYAKEEEREALAKEVSNNFLVLESGFAALDAKPFLNGASVGIADICLAPFVIYMPLFVELGGIRIPPPHEAPFLNKYFCAIREHSAAIAAFPDQQKLVASVKDWIEKNISH